MSAEDPGQLDPNEIVWRGFQTDKSWKGSDEVKWYNPGTWMPHPEIPGTWLPWSTRADAEREMIDPDIEQVSKEVWFKNMPIDLLPAGGGFKGLQGVYKGLQRIPLLNQVVKQTVGKFGKMVSRWTPRFNPRLVPSRYGADVKSINALEHGWEKIPGEGANFWQSGTQRRPISYTEQLLEAMEYDAEIADAWGRGAEEFLDPIAGVL